LAHANASQNPPSPRGVAIRGGGMPDPPSKNRKSKAACTIHRPSGSPGGGYPHPPLGDPASPRGGSAAYCTCTPAQGRFLRGDAASPPLNKTSPRFSGVFVVVRARQPKGIGGCIAGLPWVLCWDFCLGGTCPRYGGLLLVLGLARASFRGQIGDWTKIRWQRHDLNLYVFVIRYQAPNFPQRH
jgi:hypothetical protein